MIKRIKKAIYLIIGIIEKIDEGISDRVAILISRRGRSVPFDEFLKDLDLSEKNLKNS